MKNEPWNNRILLTMIIITSITFLNQSTYLVYRYTALAIVSILICLIVLMRNQVDREDLKTYLLFMIFFVFGMITLLFTGGSIASVITPLCAGMIYWLIRKSNITTKSTKIIAFAFLLINAYLIFNSFGYFEVWNVNRNDFVNPNTCSLVVLVSIIVSGTLLKRLYPTSKINFLMNLQLFLSVIAILNYESSTNLIAISAFILMDKCIPKRLVRKRIFGISVVVSTIILGVLLTIVSAEMYTSPWVSALSGRELIWADFYNQITNTTGALLFGLGSDATFGPENNTIHSSILWPIVNFGLIGFMMIYGFLIMQVNSLYSSDKLSSTQLSLFLGFISMLIVGWSEVSLFSANLFILVYLPLGLAFHYRK